MYFVVFKLPYTLFQRCDVICPPSAVCSLRKTILRLSFLSSAAHPEGVLTLSGSSTLTFLPGFARSGNTHSLLGLANTFPEDEEVSLLLAVDGPAMGVGEVF